MTKHVNSAYTNKGPLRHGIYQDCLKAADGSLLWQSDWRDNLVVESCNILLASLMKREAGISGILYWAVGSGEGTWDALMPSPEPTDTQLQNEVARKNIVADDIVFLDAAGVPSETPTARLQVSATFGDEELGGEGTVSLREFGLFGGDATGEADSGLMIDYVIHPSVTLEPGMSLTRNLHFTFGGSGQLGDGISGFGGMLPVISIDGVGEQFSRLLNGASVITIADLLRIDPLQPIETIPAVKLREFRTKARMLMGFRIDLSLFLALSERSISSVLQENPERLRSEIGSGPVTTPQIVQMQESLGILQVALDDMVLHEITLSSLSSS